MEIGTGITNQRLILSVHHKGPSATPSERWQEQRQGEAKGRENLSSPSSRPWLGPPCGCCSWSFSVAMDFLTFRILLRKWKWVWRGWIIRRWWAKRVFLFHPSLVSLLHPNAVKRSAGLLSNRFLPSLSANRFLGSLSLFGLCCIIILFIYLAKRVLLSAAERPRHPRSRIWQVYSKIHRALGTWPGTAWSSPAALCLLWFHYLYFIFIILLLANNSEFTFHWA